MNPIRLPLLLAAWCLLSGMACGTGRMVNSVRLTGEVIEGQGVTTTTAYSYDAASNRSTKTVTGGEDPGHWDYHYNSANQLTAWEKLDAPEGAVLRQATLTYDAAGNRSSQTVTGETASTALAPAEAATGTTAYTWDAQDRLASVTTPDGGHHHYAYDYRTRRTATQETPATGPAKKRAVVYAGGVSLAEYEGSTPVSVTPQSVPAVHYLRGPDMGGGVGGMLYSLRSGSIKYSLSNGRGDIVAQSEAGRTITWQASYEAYGRRVKESGTNEDRQRTNTKEEDPTGLLNEGFRYRDLETGVWLSRDPAGFVDGPNLYAYVKQNPWTAFDPLGLDTSYANDYTKQVVDRVRAADPRLDQIVREFEESPHHFEFNATWSAEDVKKYGAKGMFTPQTADRKDALPRDTHDRYNGKGMGGRINAPRENVDGKTPEQTMAHEMGHGFDANRGITPLDPNKPAPSKLFPTRSVDWEENENRVVRTENYI